MKREGVAKSGIFETELLSDNFSWRGWECIYLAQSTQDRWDFGE
jgi:hypothetical protein